jgi:hypothetical protein
VAVGAVAVDFERLGGVRLEEHEPAESGLEDEERVGGVAIAGAVVPCVAGGLWPTTAALSARVTRGSPVKRNSPRLTFSMLGFLRLTNSNSRARLRR